MAIETIGQYQLQLLALEALPSNGWDAYVSIFKFDDGMQDFKCLLEKHPASAAPLATHDEAIEQARCTGNALIASGELDHLQTGIRAGLQKDFTLRPAP